MGIRYADVIVGLQYGDEGKGKVSHALAASDEYDMVLRFNGGSNAGHTVYHNGKRVVTHQVPIGVLFGKKSVIGPGCVVNVPKLVDEIKELNALGISTTGLIFVDKRAHVVQSKHIEEDTTDNKIGTTKQGIGPTYRDKYSRTGMRMKEFMSSNEYFTVIDVYDIFYKGDSYRILCEGAQGFNLDIDWGDYPYVTSSPCTVGSVCSNGIPPHKIRKVFGVMKAYETYVGNKTTFTNEDDPVFKQIQEVGQEFGATTGRPRKVNWLNLNNAIMAMNINGVTNLIINKSDVLEQVNKFNVIYNNEVIMFENNTQFEKFIEGTLHEESNRMLTVRWSKTPHGI